MKKPIFILVGGPNGAGKSTLGQSAVAEIYGVKDYLNADFIARGMAGLPESERDVAAGKALIRLVEGHFAERKSFAVESTLSSNIALKWLHRAHKLGYADVLIYCYLPSVKTAIQRVADRVRRGGHGIPKSTIIRRYRESLRQLLESYLHISTEVLIIDNSSAEQFLIARKKNAILSVYDGSFLKKISR
jgi:predicted ABC-type ATPase